MTARDQWPLPHGKDHDQESVFRPENLLREARRQKQLPDIPVPTVCLLDPDGDIVRHLAATGTARRHPGWACYHTDMWVTAVPSPSAPPVEVGVGRQRRRGPVRRPGRRAAARQRRDLVVSITSAGQLVPLADPPYFVLVEAALRDEGTSTHYLPPARWATAPHHLLRPITTALPRLPGPVLAGRSWTTDAPYRETATAIEAARAAGAVCVEMEAAARHRDLVCLAHVTNTMATTGTPPARTSGKATPTAHPPPSPWPPLSPPPCYPPSCPARGRRAVKPPRQAHRPTPPSDGSAQRPRRGRYPAPSSWASSRSTSTVIDPK